jgi:hypothetical protein
MCLASAPSSSFPIIPMIQLLGPIRAPFPIIPRIILILVDSVAVFSGTIVMLKIRLVPLIGKELDELTVLNKTLDRNR